MRCVLVNSPRVHHDVILHWTHSSLPTSMPSGAVALTASANADRVAPMASEMAARADSLAAAMAASASAESIATQACGPPGQMHAQASEIQSFVSGAPGSRPTEISVQFASSGHVAQSVILPKQVIGLAESWPRIGAARNSRHSPASVLLF